MVQDAPAIDLDAPDQQQCLPQGAIGSFYRRQPNPKMVAGTHTFADNQLDTAITDPDLTWDGTKWHLYYQSPHGTFSVPGPRVIRHATSTDLSTWSFQEQPALTVGASGWDSTHVAAPSVVYNANAPADRKFVMLYSGASQMFPHPNYTFPDYAIGAAISADGNTFTRVASNGGKVLDANAVYPVSTDGTVADPEIILVGSTYHLWFSSFGCSGSNCATRDRYGIAHATSADAVTWTIQEAPVSSLLATASMLGSGRSQPSVVYDEPHCRYEMWMADQSNVSSQPVKSNNMTGVLHAKSATGTSWTVDTMRDVTWDSTASGEHLGLLTGADVALKGTGRYMVYVGFDDQNVPSGSTLPTGPSTSVAGVMTLNLATRDAPP